MFYIRCCVLPFFHFIIFISHLMSVFAVRWLGGSFAKLGFSVGLCGFANVPPNALNYLKTKISTVPIKAIAPVAIAIILIIFSCLGKSIASIVFVKFSVAAIKS